jgi:hypothetical protein
VVGNHIEDQFHWFKSFNPYSQVIQKTSQLAEKCLEKGANKLDLDALSKAGQMMDRGGLTKVGRALDKHGNRFPSPFPKATGKSNFEKCSGTISFG